MNKSVGKGLASAIEKGEQATEATKETLGMSSVYSDLRSPRLTAVIAGVAKDKAAEKSTVAGQKANQVSVQYELSLCVVDLTYGSTGRSWGSRGDARLQAGC